MKKILIAVMMLISSGTMLWAGNPDRRGEAGAWELNINGWARSTGLWGMNASRVRGLESERVNVAGLAHVRGSEIGFSYSQWLWGSGVGIIQGGFAQSIKQVNVIALSVQSLNFGTMYRTTTDVPEGIGTFKPSFLNIGVSFARDFGTGITGGITVRVVNQSIENISATGVAIDAGLQYVTGPKDNIHFGVAIRNVGTPMRFRGDGFNERIAFSNDGFQTTFDRRSNKFELPTQFIISASYDFLFGKRIEVSPGVYKQNLRITPNAQFTSNAFGSDHYFAGLEFSYKELFQVRGGYRFEEGVFKASTRINAYTGPSAGTSFQIPLSKSNTTTLGIDYSFRASQPFIGTHTFGMRLNIGSKKKEG